MEDRDKAFLDLLNGPNYCPNCGDSKDVDLDFCPDCMLLLDEED